MHLGSIILNPLSHNHLLLTISKPYQYLSRKMYRESNLTSAVGINENKDHFGDYKRFDYCHLIPYKDRPLDDQMLISFLFYLYLSYLFHKILFIEQFSII